METEKNKKHFKNLEKISKKYLNDLDKYIKKHGLLIYENENDFLNDSISETSVLECNLETVAVNLLDSPIYVNVFTKDDKISNDQKSKVLIDRYTETIDFYLNDNIDLDELYKEIDNEENNKEKS